MAVDYFRERDASSDGIVFDLATAYIVVSLAALAVNNAILDVVAAEARIRSVSV